MRKYALILAFLFWGFILVDELARSLCWFYLFWKNLHLIKPSEHPLRARALTYWGWHVRPFSIKQSTSIEKSLWIVDLINRFTFRNKSTMPIERSPTPYFSVDSEPCILCYVVRSSKQGASKSVDERNSAASNTLDSNPKSGVSYATRAHSWTEYS